MRHNTVRTQCKMVPNRWISGNSSFWSVLLMWLALNYKAHQEDTAWNSLFLSRNRSSWNDEISNISNPKKFTVIFSLIVFFTNHAWYWHPLLSRRLHVLEVNKTDIAVEKVSTSVLADNRRWFGLKFPPCLLTQSLLRHSSHQKKVQS